jgi:hypothetical protein
VINALWKKRDHLTISEAAHLFYEIDPNTPQLEEHMYDIEVLESWYGDIKPMHDLIESAVRSGQLKVINDTLNPTAVLIAVSDLKGWMRSKGLPLSKFFFTAKERIQIRRTYLQKQTLNQQQSSISSSHDAHNLSTQPEDVNLLSHYPELQEIISLIEDFKNSSDFKKYGVGIQQNLITDWLKLKNKDITNHKARHIKELISLHYKITTERTTKK